MTFDENDPALMAELAELGWEEDDAGGGGGVASVAAGHRPRPNAPTRGRGGEGQTSDEPRGGGASAAPAQHQGGNELLRSLGLSLNSIGDAEVRRGHGQAGRDAGESFTLSRYRGFASDEKHFRRCFVALALTVRRCAVALVPRDRVRRGKGARMGGGKKRRLFKARGTETKKFPLGYSKHLPRDS